MKGRKRRIVKRIIVSALVLALAISSVSVTAADNSTLPEVHAEQDSGPEEQGTKQPEGEETLPAASSDGNTGESEGKNQEGNGGQPGAGSLDENSTEQNSENSEISVPAEEGDGTEPSLDGDIDLDSDAGEHPESKEQDTNIEETPSDSAQTTPEPTQTPLPAAPEEEPEDFSDLMSLDELTNMPGEMVGATMFRAARNGNGTNAAQQETAADDKWYFDTYYVNQSGQYDVTQTSNFNLKYQMEFHASQDLAAGAVLIRVKEELFKNRNGSSVVPTDIGVPYGTPDGYTENRSTPFNYYRQDGYLVFFNYRKISSGTNAAWQVLYKNQNLMNIVDETSWSLIPEISVDTAAKAPTAEDPEGKAARPYDEAAFAEKTPLTGRVDSSATLTSVIKTPYSEPGKNYTPGLYTVNQVERYIDGSLPDEYKNVEGRLDTAKWRFVVWDVKVKGNATQPWKLEVLDTPGVGGDRTGAKVVGYLDHSDKTQYKVPVTAQALYPSDWTEITGVKSEESWGSRFYVVTAYPADKVFPDTVVSNDISIRLTPADGKDTEVIKDATPASWSYKDYDWSYEGEKISVTKKTDETVYTGWLDAYRQSSNIGMDYGDLPFTVTSHMYGYSDTHRTESSADYMVGDYIEGSYYTLTTVDDFMYVHDTDSSETRAMNGDDYYFSGVTIRQTDYGYDIWEDEKGDSDLLSVDPNDLPGVFQNGSEIKSEVRIYAMLANPNGNVSKDQWTLIDTVYLDASGRMDPYQFSSEVIAQQPWRVKVEHDSIDFESTCTIDLTVRLKALSEDKAIAETQVMNAVLSSHEGIQRNDQKSPVVRFENLAGAMAAVYDKNGRKVIYGDDESSSGNYSEPGLKEATKELYGGVLPARDNAFRDVTWLNEVAHGEKKSSSTNDVNNNRVLVDYYLTAYDGYEIYDSNCLDYLKKEDQTLISPGRNYVVFYDLLPYGVQFDASYPVTAGRVTDLSSTTYQTQPKSWDKTQVTVTVDPDRDIIPDYRGTGRTMVAFHIAFSGADATSYTAQKWIEGWGVSFRAYYEWKDMDQLNEVDVNANIVAFMPDFSNQEARESNLTHPALCGLKSDVDYDDGTHGDEDEGERKEIEAVYQDMVKPYLDEVGNKVTGNIDGYNPVDENGNKFDQTYRNVLYAKNLLKDDIAISTESKIEKLVRADSDRLGTFGQTASVPVGENTEGLYTYDITVTAATNTGGIVVFDRLENAAWDRGAEDPFYPFQEKPWSGTFRTIDTSGLDLAGAGNYTVYYSADENAPIPEGSREPQEILGGEEWIDAEAFAAKYGEGWEAQVKAVAVDMGSYQLEAGHSLSFRIKMQAPQIDELPDESGNYTYNNASFSSYAVSQPETRSTVVGNSVRVGISRMETLEIVKKTAGDVPSALQNEAFEFRLYEEYDYDGASYRENLAYTEYKLYKQNQAGEWELQTGQVYATDGSGYLYLHADEKAVFEVADAGRITVKETENVFWESRISERVTELVGGKYIEDRNGDIHTLTVTNTYRPVLYVQKQISAVPSDVTLTEADKTFTFQISVKGRDGQFQPLAGAEYWKVDSVRLDGGIPGKLETDSVLKTDADGRFTIMQGEIIALFPGVAGTEYELSEIEPEENWNWYCENLVLSGTLPSRGDSRTITNYYRWKNLLLTKEITHQTKEDYDEGGQAFTFRISEVSKNADGQETLTPVAGKEWVLLGESGDETGTAETGTAGILDERGEFTCAFGFRTVKIKGLEAGRTYLIEELTDGIETEKGKPLYVPNSDTLEVKMPVYSTQKTISFINDYQKRPLSVTKTVVGGSGDEYYDFTVSLKQIAADGSIRISSPENGTQYTVTKPGVPDQIRYIEEGQLKLADGETAVFKDFGMLGDEFTVTEIANEYQIYPSDKAPYTGTLSGDGGEASFINGTAGMLMISKEYVGIDEAGEKLIEEWKSGNPRLPAKTVKFILEVDSRTGEPYNSEIRATFIDQNSGEERSDIIIPGKEFDVDPWVIVIISTGQGGIPEGASYTLREAEESRHRIEWYAEIGSQMAGSEGLEHWMQISQSTASDALAAAKTVEERPIATIYNEVSTIDGFEGSCISKEMTSASDEVPEGAVLVWRLEKYDTVSGSWIPAEGVSYAVFEHYEYPVSDRVQITEADGRIRLVKADGYYPQVRFTKDQVYLNLYKEEDIVRLGGQNDPLLRLVEVPEESDSEWGMLTGYESRAQLLGQEVSLNVSPDWAMAFVNSNRETAVEVEKSMSAGSETAFTMTLKQVLSTSIPSGDAGITKENYQESITASEPRDGIPYIVYNADGSQAGEGVTGPGGEFKLYAGQYVSLNVPDGTMWTVSEKTSVTPTYTLANLEPDPGNGKLTKLNDNLMLINLPATMKYTLVFDDNGGTGGPGVLSRIAENAERVDMVIPTATPAREGYEFRGWNESSSASYVEYVPGNSVTVTSEVTTLYAVWVKKFKLTLVYNDGTDKTVVVEPEDASQEVRIPAPEVTRTGYKFKGWDISGNAQEVIYKINEPLTLTADTTLYAVWEKEKTYTVRYKDGLGGDVFGDETRGKLYEGNTTPEFSGSLTCSGYEFKGWSPEVNPIISGDDADENGEIIYTATWNTVNSQ